VDGKLLQLLLLFAASYPRAPAFRYKRTKL
jgi:hypothetical protein